MHKLIHAFTLSAITAAMLVACGGDDDTPPPIPDETVTPAPEPQPEPQPQPEPEPEPQPNPEPQPDPEPTPEPEPEPTPEPEPSPEPQPEPTPDPEPEPTPEPEPEPQPDTPDQPSLAFVAFNLPATADLRSASRQVAVLWKDRTDPANAAISIVEDTTGGAKLTATPYGPALDDVVDLLPPDQPFPWSSGGLSIEGHFGNSFAIDFGTNAGWVVVKITFDAADGDVRNGITNEYSTLWVFAPNPPAFKWISPAVISVPAGGSHTLSQPHGEISCTARVTDTSGAGFTLQGNDLKVPDGLAVGDYPVTVSQTCRPNNGRNLSSEAQATITVRVMP